MFYEVSLDLLANFPFASVIRKTSFPLNTFSFTYCVFNSESNFSLYKTKREKKRLHLDKKFADLGYLLEVTSRLIFPL